MRSSIKLSLNALRAILVLYTAVLLAGCATNPATGHSGLLLVSSKKEQRIGNKLHQDILKNETLYADQTWETYVNLIGQEIAEHSDWPDQTFKFFVLDSADVNAFALPNGHIFITTGMLSHLTKESHLAAILAHEIAHVTARHTARKLTRNTLLASVAKPLSYAMWSVPGLGLIAGNKLDAQLAKTQSVLVRGYGRELELQADALGAKYLAAAGYQPEDMLDVLIILKDHEEYRRDQVQQEVSKELELGVSYHASDTDTHPTADQRLQEVLQAAQAYLQSGAARQDRENYFTMVDGLKVAGQQRFALDADWAEMRALGKDTYTFLPYSLEPLDATLLAPDHRVYLPENHAAASFTGLAYSHKVYLNAQNQWESTYLNDVIITHNFSKPDNRSAKEFLLEYVNEQAQSLDYLDYDEVGSPFGDAFYIRANATRTFTNISDASQREHTLEHLYGVVFLKDRAIVIENYGGGLGFDSPLKPRLFKSILANVRDTPSSAIIDPVPRESYELTIYQAQPGDTFEALTQHVMLEQATEKLRLINGMYPNRQPDIGQAIKVFSVTQ